MFVVASEHLAVRGFREVCACSAGCVGLRFAFWAQFCSRRRLRCHFPFSWIADRPANRGFSPHLFPIALWIFDDFAWTCARNSVIFAVVVSLSSLVGGAFLGWVIGRRRCWGRWLLHPLIVAMVAVPPAFVALGLLGVLGGPRPWPWPFSVVNGGIAGRKPRVVEEFATLDRLDLVDTSVRGRDRDVCVDCSRRTTATIVGGLSTVGRRVIFQDLEDLDVAFRATVVGPCRCTRLRDVIGRAGAAFDSRAAPHARISSRADRPSHRSVSFGCRLGGHDGSVRTRGLGHLAMVGRQPDQ